MKPLTRVAAGVWILVCIATEGLVLMWTMIALPSGPYYTFLVGQALLAYALFAGVELFWGSKRGWWAVMLLALMQVLSARSESAQDLWRLWASVNGHPFPDWGPEASWILTALRVLVLVALLFDQPKRWAEARQKEPQP